MANPFDKKDFEERSGFWGFGATASIAGGVGYGLYRAHPAVRSAMALGGKDGAAETAAELRTLGRFNVASVNKTAAVDDIGHNILTSLAETGGTKTVQGDIASASYEAALRSGRNTHTEAYQVYQEVLNQTSVRNSYLHARTSLEKIDGDVGLLTSKISDLGQGGFYGKFPGGETGRLAEISKATFSTGEFVESNIARDVTSLSKLQPKIADKALDVQKRLSIAAGKSGGEIKWSGVFEVQDVLEGQTITTPMLKGKLGSEMINIPLADTGLTYGGKHLTAKYTTRGSFGEVGDIKSFTNEYVDKLEEVMSAQKTKTGLKNSVIKANHEIINTMRNRDAAHRSMAVWKMPEAMLPSGGRVKSRMNLMEAVYAGGEMTDDIRSQIIAESTTGTGGRGLFPIGSPDTVAKGTFMQGNIAEDIYGPMGRLMGIERRPTQFIREEWGATEAAKKAAPQLKGKFGEFYSRVDRKIQGEGYKDILYGGEEALSAKAYSAPQLTTFYAKPELMETGELAGKMFQEEVVISGKAAPMMEYERTVQKKISLDQGFRTNSQIMDALKGKKAGELVDFSPFGQGGFVGIEQGSGKELWAEGPKGAKQQIAGAQLTGKNQATVFMKETHRLPEEDYWKFFSEDVKFMGQQASEQRMGEIAQAAGISQKIANQEIEAITSGKLVQRNKMALMTQQTEALSWIMSDKMAKGEIDIDRSIDAFRFMENPAEYLKVNRLQGDNIANAEFAIQKNMVALSKKFGFSAEETGLTFGLMDGKAAEKLGILNEVAKSRGVVGLSKMRLGDLSFEGGAGGLGKFEQTGFRALSMKGEEGQRFAAELATRIKGKNEMIASDRMMASMLNEQGVSDRFKQFMGSAPMEERTLGRLSPEDLIQEKGRYVNVGQKLDAFGGASKIYVPGKSEAESMVSHMITDKGRRIESPVVKELESLRRLAAGSAPAEEMEVAAAKLRSSVVQRAEQQASASGKILGSRYLTGIRQTAAQTAEANAAFRISPKTADRMFNELIDRAESDTQKTFLAAQKKALLEKEEQLIGGMWRHPTTGPESFQFARYQVDHNLADEMIAAPYQMGKLSIGGKVKDVDVSPMVGMKGDFDKDMFNIAAISDRDTMNRLSKKMSGEIQEGYTGYLFNHYAMQDLLDERKGTVKSIVEMSQQEAIEQGARNLTTAKTSTGQVNVALQKLKLGMQNVAPKEYRPMAELFYHLEEAAIGGKHGAYQGKIYQDIAHAVNQKDASTMESVIKQLMGETDRQVSGSITGPSGQLTEQTMKYSPRVWAEQAIQAADIAGEDVDIAMRSARAAKGNVGQDINQLTEMYYKRRTGSLDVAQSVMQAKDYGMPGYTEKTNRILRRSSGKMRAITSALKKAKAPAMIGLAVGAGVMLSAPSVSGSLSSPMEGPAGGTNLGHNDIGPPAGPGMSPPSPRIMSSPKAYDMSGIKTASRANIRMSMPDANAAGSDFMRHAGDLSSNGNVRIRTTDDRSALSSHRLANKIHERL